MTPEASLVIPTFNKGLYLESTLQSLRGQKNAVTFEVVVVDDGSTDDTPALIRALPTDYPLRYLRNATNLGRAATRNIGLRQAAGPLIIFLDDDQVVNDEFISQHLQWGGPRKIVVGKNNEFSVPTKFAWPLKGDTPLAWLTFASANISAWREDLLAVGGFDEKFSGWGCEDTELGYRLSQAQTTYVYQPKAEAFHLPHPRGNHRLQEWYANWHYFYQKHPQRDVELLALHVAQRITFEVYQAEVHQSLAGLATDFILGPDDFHALYADCVLADEIRSGREVVLALAPTVVLQDRESKTLTITGTGQPIEAQGILQESVLRLNGRTPLSQVIKMVSQGPQALANQASKIRQFISVLIFFGLVREVHSPAIALAERS